MVVFAIDRPSPDARLLENFGGNKNGTPLLGDIFAAEGPVFAAEEGELVFKANAEERAGRIPSTMGAWVAVDHGNNMLSVYGHLQDESSDLDTKLEKTDLVGMAGKTGWAKSEGFNLTIFDRKEKRWVNPSLVVSSVEDTRTPSIQYVRLRNSAGREIDISQTRTISQGRWSIIVYAEDTQFSFTDSLMPSKITCSVNGLEAGALALETFYARDGNLMMYRNGLIPVSQIYQFFPAVEAGETWFNRGQATLEVIVEDIAKNKRVALYKLFVE
ncbi:MAG: hypothetical protein Ta2B_24290 [Termitinemataceae bacterium]|nr:MAG: hypothetical protein Ta2B_24290 [Termitinemataceae bacterium]